MKNSKRTFGLKALSFILVAALFLSISVPAFAVDNEPSFLYEFIDGESISIIEANLDTSDKTLVIPSEIDGYTVVAIGSRTFADYKDLEAVEIPLRSRRLALRLLQAAQTLTPYQSEA